jgi:hypothetical protein
MPSKWAAPGRARRGIFRERPVEPHQFMQDAEHARLAAMRRQVDDFRVAEHDAAYPVAGGQGAPRAEPFTKRPVRDYKFRPTSVFRN